MFQLPELCGHAGGSKLQEPALHLHLQSDDRSPLSALRELLLSAQKEKPIFLVVILPSLDTLASALQRPSVMRLQTAHCTQFVSSICDFEDMLMKVSSGIISRLAFVIPVRDTDLETLHPNQVWNSATKILGSEHCIQAADADRVSEYVV